MPEQLTLHQAGRNRSAVQLHQRLIPTLAELVDSPGNQFLPRPGLTSHQRRGVGASNALDERQDLPHGRGISHQVFHLVCRPHFFLEIGIQALQGVALGLGFALFVNIAQDDSIKRLPRRRTMRQRGLNGKHFPIDAYGVAPLWNP
jgi:hypothetical protein